MSIFTQAFPTRALSPAKPFAGRYSCFLADRISDVDNAAWDRLTDGAGCFLSRRYLRALERTRPENLEPRYALVTRGRQAVAAVAAQSLRVDAAGFVHRRPSAPPSRLRARLLVCGNVFSWGSHGLALSRQEDPGELWPAVIRALERLGPRTDAVAVKDLDPAEPSPPGFRPLATEPDMVLDLPAAWSSMDDYLAALRTRYRRAARRVARQLAAAGCRVEPATDLDAVAGRLHELYLAVHDAARVRPATPRASYLPELARVFEDDLRCSVIRRDDEIVGFVITLKDGDNAVGYHLGFDRELGAGVPLYVGLLHATLADALALDCRRLSLGRTALESKARLGAIPRPLRIGWKGYSRLGRALDKVVDLSPEAAPARRPFKASGISS